MLKVFKKYYDIINTKVQRKEWGWVSIYIIIPIFLFITFFFALTNNIFGWTKEGARAVLDNKGIGSSNIDALKAGYNNLNQNDINLLKKVDNDPKYIIAGALLNYDKSKEIINNNLNKDIDITKKIDSLGEYINNLGLKEDYVNLDCYSLLNLAVIKRDSELVNDLIKKGKVSNLSDCSLITAIKENEEKTLGILIKNKFGLNKSSVNNLVENGEVGVSRFLKSDNVDDNTINTLYNMKIKSSELEVKEAIETSIAGSVYANYKEIDLDKELDRAIENKKYTFASTLIKQGANYSNKSEVLTNIALKEKNDLLLATLIEKDMKFETLVSVQEDGVSIKENYFYFAIKNKMFKTANQLLEKGFDINSKYKPNANSTEEFPIVFASVIDKKGFPLLDKLVTRGNAVAKLNQNDNQKFIAFFLDVMSKDIQKKDVEIFRILLEQNININSTINYDPNSVNTYESKEYPVWSTPLYNTSKQTSFSNNNIEALKLYIDLILPRIEKFDFVRELKTSIGLATHLNQPNLVKVMLDKGISPSSIESTNNKEQILTIALRNNYKELTDVILNSKIDLNAEIPSSTSFNDKTTFLIDYLDSNKNPSIEILKKIIDKGADINKCVMLTNGNKLCPLQIAQNKNSKSEVTEFLKEKGAKID
jgi:hypothetical protein